MHSGDYLTLRSARLKSSELWASQGKGLLFVFAREGSGTFASNGTQQVISPGDLLVFNRDSGGSLAANRQNEFMFLFFSICVENLYPLFGIGELNAASALEASFKNKKYYPATHPVSLAGQRLLAEVPAQFNLEHRAQLLRIVASVLNPEVRTSRAASALRDTPEQHVLRIFESLSVTEMLGLSVGELAARFGCSRRHLNRLFHEHFGLSVAAMRMEMRLLKAISLLRDPTAKIIHVAEDCGFNHLGLFNTCFKRRFGASPGRWRKLVTGSNPRSGRDVFSRTECPLKANGLCPTAVATGAPVQKAPETAPKTPTAQRLVASKVFAEAQCDPVVAKCSLQPAVAHRELQQ